MEKMRNMSLFFQPNHSWSNAWKHIEAGGIHWKCRRNGAFSSVRSFAEKTGILPTLQRQSQRKTGKWVSLLWNSKKLSFLWKEFFVVFCSQPFEEICRNDDWFVDVSVPSLDFFFVYLLWKQSHYIFVGAKAEVVKKKFTFSRQSTRLS